MFRTAIACLVLAMITPSTPLAKGRKKGDAPAPPPVEIEASSIHASLPDLPDGIGHDETGLFEGAADAFALGWTLQAAQLWEHYLVDFPQGRHTQAARFNAGLAREALREWQHALDHYALVEPGDDDLALHYKLPLRRAACHVELGQWAETLQATETLAAVPGVPRTLVGLAEVFAGRALTGLERFDEAEVRMEALLGDLRNRDPDPWLAAQVRFHLAEMHRKVAQSHLITQVDDLASAQRVLDAKATATVAAQDYYLDTIAQGNPEMAAMAGYHLGKLYEEFREGLLASPPPKELVGEELQVYRDELRTRTRVLLEKARVVYEKILGLRTVTELPETWLQRIENSLARLEESAAR